MLLDAVKDPEAMTNEKLGLQIQQELRHMMERAHCLKSIGQSPIAPQEKLSIAIGIIREMRARCRGMASLVNVFERNCFECSYPSLSDHLEREEHRLAEEQQKFEKMLSQWPFVGPN
jgi:hypothetical protein